jgi:hypothetical protein
MCHGKMHFFPERDTLFFRTPYYYPLLLDTIRLEYPGLTQVKHIAIPLDESDPHAIPMSGVWQQAVQGWASLKTVTFMLGCNEKSWLGEEGIELRSLEQWFVDGRDRKVSCRDGVKIDVAAVGEYMMSDEYATAEIGPVGPAGLNYISGRARNSEKLVKVRVVAWKRGLCK